MSVLADSCLVREIHGLTVETGSCECTWEATYTHLHLSLFTSAQLHPSLMLTPYPLPFSLPISATYLLLPLSLTSLLPPSLPPWCLSSGMGWMGIAPHESLRRPVDPVHSLWFCSAHNEFTQRTPRTVPRSQVGIKVGSWLAVSCATLQGNRNEYPLTQQLVGLPVGWHARLILWVGVQLLATPYEFLYACLGTYPSMCTTSTHCLIILLTRNPPCR